MGKKFSLRIKNENRLSGSNGPREARDLHADGIQVGIYIVQAGFDVLQVGIGGGYSGQGVFDGAEVGFYSG